LWGLAEFIPVGCLKEGLVLPTIVVVMNLLNYGFVHFLEEEDFRKCDVMLDNCQVPGGRRRLTKTLMQLSRLRWGWGLRDGAT
jgi:hypothetical protein